VELDLAKRAGAIADWFPQVSLPYGVAQDGSARRYVADFLVVEQYLPNGTFVARIEDTKGAATERSTAKMAALRARGLRVDVLR
jgi:hypothetical protein